MEIIYIFQKIVIAALLFVLLSSLLIFFGLKIVIVIDSTTFYIDYSIWLNFKVPFITRYVLDTCFACRKLFPLKRGALNASSSEQNFETWN